MGRDPAATAAIHHDVAVATVPATQWIDLDGAVNARVVAPGVLLRADNLQALTRADVRCLLDEHGVQTVVDLRTSIEIAMEGPGPLTREPSVRIEHRSLYPESGHTDLDADTVRPWDEAAVGEIAAELPTVRAYLGYLRRRPDSVAAAVRTIALADQAVLVHCAAGKDRTGVVVALALDAAGTERAAIVADYLATRERIVAIMDRLASSPTYRDELVGHDPHDHAPLAGTIERVLEIVEREHGGAAAWLQAHGLDDGDLARLRRRLGPAGG